MRSVGVGYLKPADKRNKDIQPKINYKASQVKNEKFLIFTLNQ